MEVIAKEGLFFFFFICVYCHIYVMLAQGERETMRMDRREIDTLSILLITP